MIICTRPNHNIKFCCFINFNAITLFNSKNASTDLEKSYLIALGNRIITVGQNINTIYQVNNTNVGLVTSNLASMTNINDVIKGLV